MKKNIPGIQKEICAAGLRLVKEGLVARSWGNISIRIDDDTMAITPSGIRYEDVRPEHIAVVNLADGSWQCSVKPSGERKLHIAIYRDRPDAGAVIHTHQMNASVCAAARINFPVSDSRDRKILRTDTVCCGAYGLPGTKKLTRETVAAVKGGMCALMANHGAVCIGADIEEAFRVAQALERACGNFIAARFTEATGITPASAEAMRRHYESTRMTR
ncbi:MAG: class II aldolase/adducin family protein [Spirochaetota bacterium]